MRLGIAVIFAVFCATVTYVAAADDVLPRIDQRFAKAQGDETPDFQKHVMPLFGRLGCNGRACHGSFQGRGAAPSAPSAHAPCLEPLGARYQDRHGLGRRSRGCVGHARKVCNML